MSLRRQLSDFTEDAAKIGETKGVLLVEGENSFDNYKHFEEYKFHYVQYLHAVVYFVIQAILVLSFWDSYVEDTQLLLFSRKVKCILWLPIRFCC